MSIRLLVTTDFAEYAVGDRITDARTIKRVTASHPEYVIRESVADGGEDAPDAAPAAAEVPADADTARRGGRVTRHTVTD